jgi:osmoprotectant transport system ATP-binding protein
MLEIRNLTKMYGEGEEAHLAVDNVNLKVKQGEFVVLIGPSGCGKTTTLKMINRLVDPTSGEILINGTPTSRLNVVELRRNIGYVIQNIGLFPHMTIAANVEIVPKLRKLDKAKRRTRTHELLDMVGLDPDIYASRYPAELSGGQQQRIGVLRALAAEPDLILMDEPFGALDPITRDQLQDEMKDLQQRLNKTIVFVTHDIDEALKLADTIVLMKDGKIVQAASVSVKLCSQFPSGFEIV